MSQRGGATNSFKKILDKQHINNPVEFQEKYNFYTATGHGVLNGLSFIVPENTYILFLTNASELYIRSNLYSNRRDIEYNDTIFKNARDTSVNSASWYQRLYDNIVADRFFKSIMYPDNDVTKIGDTRNPLTSIYEPGDLVQDMELHFEENMDQKASSMWGLWKLPIPFNIKDALDKVNETHLKIISDYKKKNTDTLLSPFRNVEYPNDPINSFITTIESIIDTIYVLDYISDLQNKLEEVKTQIDTEIKTFIERGNILPFDFKLIILRKVVTFMNEIIPKLLKDLGDKESSMLRKTEEGMVDHENQYIGKLSGVMTDAFGGTFKRRLFPSINYSLHGLINEMNTTITPPDKINFIIVLACRGNHIDDDKYKHLSRSLSVGVRNPEQFSKKSLIDRGISTMGVLESGVFPSEYIFNAFTAGDQAYIVNINPAIDGKRVVITGRLHNFKTKDGLIIVDGYTVVCDDVKMIIKPGQLSKNRIISTILDTDESKRLKPKIDELRKK